MASPQVRSVSPVAQGTGAITVSLPTGWQQNDILLLVLESANEGVIVPAGYTEIIRTGTGTAGTNSGIELVCAWKRAGTSESNLSIVDSGDHTSGVLLAISGCESSSDPVFFAGGWPQTTDASTVSFGGVTTTSNDNLFLFLVAGNRDATSTNDVGTLNNSTLTNLTEHVDSWHALGFGGGLYVGSGVKNAAGTPDDTTASITTQTFIRGLVVLLPEVDSVYSDEYSTTYEIKEAITSDLAVEYDVPTPAVLAPSWFDRLTTTKNTWYDLEEYNSPSAINKDISVAWQVAGSVYQDSETVSYTIFAARENDLTAQYTVAGDTGIIGGGGPLPWASISNPYSNQWKIFHSAPFSDRQAVYQIKVAVEKSLSTQYTVYTSPQADLAVTYQMDGPQTSDGVYTYQVIVAVEKDLSPQYQIISPVYENLQVTYQVSSSTVLADLDLEYNLVSSVEQDLVVVTDVFNPVDPLDLAAEYTVYNSAQATLSPVWEVAQSYYAYANLVIAYQVERPALVVPNLKGMKLHQAKQAIRNARLSLGKITYGT